MADLLPGPRTLPKANLDSVQEAARYIAETRIADFLGDVHDGRLLNSNSYEDCLRPLARRMLDDLADGGFAIVEARR